MRAVRVWIVLLSAMLGLAGCAVSPQLIPVTDQARRLEFPEFSLLPPPGPNWFIAPKTLQAQQGLLVSFAKVTTPPSKTHTVVAGVRGQRGVYTGGSREELLKKLAQLTVEPTDRLQPVSIKTSPDSILGQNCIRYDAAVKDSGVPGYAGSTFLMESHGLICLHPTLPDAAMEIFYSERRLQEDQPLPLAAEGEAFLKSLQFK